MKVIYDYQVFNMQRYGGISRYIFEIASGINNIDGCSSKILAPLHINEYLTHSEQIPVLGIKRPDHPRGKRALGIINAKISTHLLKKMQPDILHETYYSDRNIAPKKCKTVLTVYDMIHEKFPHLMNVHEQRISQLKISAAQRADHIICISENTKNDLLKTVNLNPSKISVIHIAQSLKIPSESTFSLQKDQHPFILYVGQRGGYKNFQTLLKAYGLNQSLNSNFKLICFGSDQFNEAENQLIDSLGLTNDQVSQISGTDEFLAYLYSQASAFIYPSLYEGFGIPILEAMSLGCPVICSNTSSFPEIAGNAAEFFDPTDVENMAEMISTVVFSPEKTIHLQEAGKIQSQRYSWTTCVEKTLAVYRSLLS
jgi:glycosyltransferase involved in cell wall biosynthesis